MLKIQDYKLPHPLLYLYLNRLIILIGVGSLAIFLPIFLFIEFGYDYVPVMIYYLVLFALSIILHTFGAMAISKIGLRKSMALAILFLVGYFLVFFIYDYYPHFYLIVLAVLASNFWRTLYWVPFHTDCAKFSSKTNRGKQYSVFLLLADIIGILIPVIAGLILNYYNYSALFIIAMVIILASIIPLFKIKKVKETYSYTFTQTYQELFSRKNRKMLYAYMADGSETIVGALIWPIFIFEILNGEFLAVGAISTIIIGVTVMLDIIIGRWADKFEKKNIVKYSSGFYALGWIIKIFVGTAFQIFIVSTYHNLTAIFRRLPFDALMYEKAADQGHYVDEYTVLREIALNIGRVLMLLFVILLLYYFSIYIAFVLAAITSLFINILE